VSATPDFMLGYAVTFLVSILALWKWSKWYRIAMREAARADRAEDWMWKNSDWADEAYPMPAPTNSGHKSHGDNFCSIFDQSEQSR
jgi:hypothetical protein